MNQDAINIFADKLKNKIGNKFTLSWDTDRKGMVCAWCKLENASDITKAAEVVADFKGRVMTISCMLTSCFEPAPDSGDSKEKPKHVEIKYHFYFERVNCTVGITLPGDSREIESITPILKSADWHEREMQDFYKIKLIGHPNPVRLFLDKDIKLDKNAMVPLSAAMNGSSTNTLWEQVMKSSGKGAKSNE